jgi:hypothetical protein
MAVTADNSLIRADARTWSDTVRQGYVVAGGEIKVEELVHVLGAKHVGVQQHDLRVFRHVEGTQLGPCWKKTSRVRQRHMAVLTVNKSFGHDIHLPLWQKRLRVS